MWPMSAVVAEQMGRHYDPKSVFHQHWRLVVATTVGKVVSMWHVNSGHLCGSPCRY